MDWCTLRPKTNSHGLRQRCGKPTESAGRNQLATSSFTTGTTRSPAVDRQDPPEKGWTSPRKTTVSFLNPQSLGRPCHSDPDIQLPRAKTSKAIEQSLRKVLSRHGSLSFRELEGLLRHLGFVLERVRGSHPIYRHARVSRPLNVQPKRAEAKCYQLDQLRSIIVEFRLLEEQRWAHVIPSSCFGRTRMASGSPMHPT